MRHERQVALLKRYVGFRAGALPDRAPQSMRNPASAYTDPERFAREITRLFRQRPVPVGLSCECRTPGSYIATALGDFPVIVMRQTDGSLRGFVNACRHRGAPLLGPAVGVSSMACSRWSLESAKFDRLGGEGLRSIVCPYHGWTYGLDGALRARPLAWGFDDIDPTDCHLIPVAVAEQYGIVFAHAGAAAPIVVDDLLDGMRDEIAEYGLERYTHVETRSREWSFNWKLVIDTFTEPYHIPALHQRSIGRDYDFRNPLWDAYGLAQRTVNFRMSIEQELREKPEAEQTILPHTTIEYFLLPNVVLTHQLDHIELWRALPISVDRTRVFTSLYAAEPPVTESAQRHWKKNLDRLLAVTETEDFPMMAEIQRGLASGAVMELIYGKLEPALIHFHSSLNRLLAPATPEDGR